MAVFSDISELRVELEHVHDMLDDWKKRGSPPAEGPQIQARMAAAEAAVKAAVRHATETPVPDLAVLRTALEHARWLVQDWELRGSPPAEGPALKASVAAYEATIANAIGGGTPEAPPQEPHHAALPAAPAPRTPRAATPEAILDRETDARFYAQTNYAVGKKLDASSNPADRAMIKVWNDIHMKVQREDAAGKLRLTYNNPVVQKHLDSAAAAHDKVVDNLNAAATAPTPEIQKRHVRAAAQAYDDGKRAAQRAAAYQPPTVSPHVATAAAVEALYASGEPAAAAVADGAVAVLDANHPANAPAAQPSHPDLATPAPMSGPPQPPQTVADHVKLTTVQAAPKTAIDVHEDAARQPPPPVPKPIEKTGAKSWFAEHAEVLAIGGAITVGGIIAVLTTRHASRQRPARSRVQPRAAALRAR